MKPLRWKDAVEIFGIVAIVASLIFVGLQIQQDQEIAIADAISLRVSASAELANLVQSNKDIWIRGLNGEELSAQDHVVFAAVLDVVENHFLTLYVRFGRIGPFPMETAAREYAYGLYQYPSARKVFAAERIFDKARNDGFDTPAYNNFRILVEQYIAELDAKNVPIEPEKPYIFW